MIKKISGYLDLAFLLKFIVLLVSFYGFNLFYVAITHSKGLLYSAFLDNNLNYIQWLRISVLYTSNAIVHTLGVNSYVALPNHLRVLNSSFVNMDYSCIGLGLMSFWAAFVLAHTGSFKKKLIWCLFGIMSIWFINAWRVALLLIAFEKRWKVNSYLDHHTLFNIVAYCVLALLIYYYTTKSDKEMYKLESF